MIRVADDDQNSKRTKDRKCDLKFQYGPMIGDMESIHFSSHYHYDSPISPHSHSRPWYMMIVDCTNVALCRA